MRNPFKTFSFQVTFFASFIIISALLISVLGITSYYIVNQEVVDQTISSRRLLLDEINKQLDLQLQSVEYDSLVLASNPKLINYLQQSEDSFERVGQNSDMIDLLSRLSYVKEGIHSVQLYAKDTSVNIHIGGNGVYDDRLLTKSVWFNDIKDADYCWVGTHTIEVGSYPAGDRTVVSFARKVLSASGKQVGVLVVNVKMPFIQKIASSSATDVNRFILDTRGRLIAQFYGGPDNPASYASMMNKLAAILDQPGSEHSAIANLGEKSLVIWNKQERTLWVTMDIIPWKDITKGSRRIENIILAAAVLCILLAIIMAYLLSRQFVVPIRKLIHTMNVMKIGKLNVQIANDYHNEFGHLNENFNQMTTRIDTLMLQVNEQNRRKREAEIQILQEQINPHFLYNTLDMMNWHAIESGAHDISRMLSLLGKMLRIGLSSGATFIPVGKEIEHLQCYMELQKIRYRQNVAFSISVPEEMMHYYTPKLIIQPFVENSLLHGLHSRNEGIVRISGWEEEQTIYFSIEDNGVGMDPGAALPRRDHNGIRNVHERIQLYFGERYGVDIDSEPDKGTTIRLSLPKILTEAPLITEGENDDQGGNRG
ncbi:sensor histidine kinase [Paenibacillus beijingensis]|uniref:sensor histidine kinase n=1 Tax=Paenibacillus beijingensis TaxID=1126833 RepID=UPI00130EFA30|nr:sensor histidine kinase [Paenibacillus beijingensis]